MAAKKLNLDNFLPYRLSIASNTLSSRIAAEYQNRFGLKIPEWRLMAAPGEGKPKTQRALVAAPRMDKVTV
ncbi:MAG TPA: MarR family transcriptional regulator, partial [Sphingopyxis sp.]|nr:MarR family transcriptional regulator [Sphingopyxis sp.]